MNETTWKILAIVFIILFACETLLFVWGYATAIQEDKAINECYYNTCSENYDTDYSEGVCTCYDLDTLGNYVISKTEYQ